MTGLRRPLNAVHVLAQVGDVNISTCDSFPWQSDNNVHVDVTAAICHVHTTMMDKDTRTQTRTRMDTDTETDWDCLADMERRLM